MRVLNGEMDSNCMYMVKRGQNIGEYCGAQIATTDQHCEFHKSVVKRDTPGPPKLSWTHYIKPRQEDSNINYENFPKRKYEGYEEWLEECDDAYESENEEGSQKKTTRQ